MKQTIKSAIKSLLTKRMDITTDEVESLTGRVGFVTQKTNKDELNMLLQKLYPTIGQNQALIRLGPKGDGGYLVPDDLDGIEACFSPGVDQVSGFEKDCAELGMKVFMADKSVETPAGSHPLFHFEKKFIGAINNNDFMTLDSWVESSLPNSQSDLLLQIDIEGAEYETFLNTSNQLMQRFRIIVGEFHHIDQLWSAPFFQIVSRVFEKILQTHTCIHNHPNNCCGSLQKEGLEMPRVTELTFVRNDRLKTPTYICSYPNPLDFDNTNQPTLPLPKCWYHSTKN